jgi:hypothetical protein
VVAKALKLNVRFDEKLKGILERARRLWRIAHGELPLVTVPITLQRNERCSADVEALHYEPPKLERRISYSGFSSLYGASGIRFRSGVMNRTTQHQTIALRGAGTVFQQAFIQRRSRINVHRSREVTGITFYSDGMRIEKEAATGQISLSQEI